MELPHQQRLDAEKKAREIENVMKYLSGKKVIKTIYVKNRLLNFVVK